MNAKPEVIVENEPKDFYAPPGEDHEEGVEAGTLTVINAAEINQQIATARRYPRSPAQFRRKVYELATYNVDVAESCIYALPRDGKMIDGPSIRFAENLQIAWGNCRSSTEVTEVGDKFVTAEGIFFDLETNSAIKAKIMRRITTKSGKRYSDDMIATTGNAACSIALRNAILRGIPKSLWYEIFDATKKVAGGTAQTFTARRDRVLKDLGVQGATPEMIFGLLGIKGAEDMQTEHVVHLRGLQNAIKDGETTIEAAFAGGEAELAPGQVAPPRPKKSEFERGDQGKAVSPPAASDPKEAKEAAQPSQGRTEAAAEAGTRPEPHQEAKPAQAAPEAKGDRIRDDQKEWFEGRKAALAGLTRIIDVADLRDEVRPGLFAEQEAAWDAACDARSKAIMNPPGKAKKG